MTNEDPKIVARRMYEAWTNGNCKEVAHALYEMTLEPDTAAHSLCVTMALSTMFSWDARAKFFRLVNGIDSE